MTRKHSNHITVQQAAARGMSLSQWARHEAKEQALDAKEAERMGTIAFTLLGLVVACFVIALLLIGAPIR